MGMKHDMHTQYSISLSVECSIILTMIGAIDAINCNTLLQKTRRPLAQERRNAEMTTKKKEADKSLINTNNYVINSNNVKNVNGHPHLIQRGLLTSLTRVLACSTIHQVTFSMIPRRSCTTAIRRRSIFTLLVEKMPMQYRFYLCKRAVEEMEQHQQQQG